MYPKFWPQLLKCHPSPYVSSGRADCLQDFTAKTGRRIESFKHVHGNGLQILDTDYFICIMPEKGFCGIQYSECHYPDHHTDGSTSMSFSITGGIPSVGSAVRTACNRGWITIPCATNSKRPHNIDWLARRLRWPDLWNDLQLCSIAFRILLCASSQWVYMHFRHSLRLCIAHWETILILIQIRKKSGRFFPALWLMK